MSSVINVNVASFIPRLQRQVAQGHSVQRSTADSVNGFVDLISEDLVNVVKTLLSHAKKKTVDVYTIQCALRLSFPESLALFATSAGTMAVKRYQESDVSTRSSRSKRAGLVFPVSRFSNLLKRTSHRMTPTAAIFMTAVLEFIVTEIMESSAEVTSSGKRKQITVSDVDRSIWGDRYTIKTRTGSSYVTGDGELQILAKRVRWTSDGWNDIFTGKRTRRHVEPQVSKSTVDVDMGVDASASASTQQ
jgi:histone H2A